MANLEDALTAANKRPQDRTPEDNALITHNNGDQRVRDASAAAAREQRIYGKKPAK